MTQEPPRWEISIHISSHQFQESFQTIFLWVDFWRSCLYRSFPTPLLSICFKAKWFRPGPSCAVTWWRSCPALFLKFFSSNLNQVGPAASISHFEEESLQSPATVNPGPRHRHQPRPCHRPRSQAHLVQCTIQINEHGRLPSQVRRSLVLFTPVAMDLFFLTRPDWSDFHLANDEIFTRPVIFTQPDCSDFHSVRLFRFWARLFWFSLCLAKRFHSIPIIYSLAVGSPVHLPMVRCAVGSTIWLLTALLFSLLTINYK